MEKPLETKIKNNKQKELKTWQKLIQPIIDGYGIKCIEYEFMPAMYNLVDRIKMERSISRLCNPRNKRPFDSFHELFIKWQNSTPDPPDGIFSYKTYFIEFMSHLKEDNTLPHFLEFLHREYEDEIPSNLKIDEVKKSQPFPCEPGTKWKNVKITLIDDSTVRVETPQGKGLFTFHQLGFSDQRSPTRETLPWILLKKFAQNQGIISKNNIEYNRNLTDTAKRLDKQLQNLFKINDRIYVGHYKDKKAYETKIFFSDQTLAIKQTF